MAEVFLAQDELLGRQVALKVLHPEFARDSAFIERFRREARAAASLNDPRIVSVFDWGSDDGTYYIVMEYVQGKSLREVIQTEGPLSPQRSAEIAADVCGALHLAHQQGLVHRDIKPANIAITPGSQTKVMDFGIARQSRDSGQTVTQTGTVMGTAAYLSPEQAQGFPVDARSDVYSVGVVLYEMITGDVPFKADTPVAVAYKHVTEAPVPPSRINDEVPPGLDAVVMKAMAKNSDNRYQTAEEMRADIARVLAGRPVQATPLLQDEDTDSSYARSDVTVITPRRVSGDRTAIIERTEVPRDPRRGLVYALTFLLFFGLVIGAVALAFSLFGPSNSKVEVPSVVGRPLEEAQTILEQAGLRSKIAGREFSETIPEGFVVSQNPDDGVKADEDSTVDLVISKGPDRIEVPDLVGKTEAEAKALIEAAGLKVGTVRPEVSRTVEQGKVISQTPAPRERVEKETAVDLVVSSGKQTVRVPDVIGLSEERAKDIILGRNLEVVVKETCQADKKNATVVEQDPKPGTDVPEGSNVTITVNRAVAVPGVEGKKKDDAKAELEAAGFKVEVENGPPLPGRKDEVIDQTPEGGKLACKGDTVRIVVGT